MSETFVKALVEEEARLLGELEAVEAFQKLRLVQGLLQAYRGQHSVVDPVPKRVRAPVGEGKAGAMEIVNAAREYLREKGGRAETPEIVAALERKGLRLGTDKKVATVSSYLSHYKALFNNVRGQGYGLNEWNDRGSSGSQSDDAGNKIEAASPGLGLAAE